MTTEASPGTTPKRPKHRSPSYPALDLGKAVQRAKQLELIAGRHPAPISAALEAWGYTAKSSNGFLTIAALKKFGLAEDDGKNENRQIRLTQLGYELVFRDDQRDSQEWQERAHEAAFKPQIHSELWSKYFGDLPSDGVIQPHLVLERGFSPEAAKDVLREFRATIAFAKIGKADAGGSVSENDTEAEANDDMTAPATIDPPAVSHVRKDEPRPEHTGSTDVIRAGVARTVQVPFSPGQWALLQAPFPMTEAEWKQMLAVLDAMKPGLVTDE